MDNLLTEFERISQKQSELDVKTKESFEAALSKFASYDNALKNQYALVGKFIKSIDKRFKLELTANDEKINMDSEALELAIVNHFFREGRFEIGEAFAQESSIMVPDDLKSQFVGMFEILESMKGNDLLPAIRWCEVNREKLVKRGSNLEFSLHELQFLHLLCHNSRQEALQYARKNFQPFAEANIKGIQRLMASVIYAPRLEKSPYADLLSPKHWHSIQSAFTREFCTLLGFPSDSPLYTGLVVGTTALPKLMKLNSIMKEKKAEWSQQDELPIEIELGNDQRYHSIFACPVLKQVSTEDNPPMIMPCGHVICKEALVRLSKGNSSRFKCPYCPSESVPSQAQRVYF